MKRFLLLAAAVTVLSGFGFSSSEKTWRSYSFVERELRRQPANVQMPSGLWDQLDKFARTTGGLKADDEVETEFVALKAFMIEKNRGILGRENFELRFPVGGGEIDMSDFVQPLKGSFYFVTEFLPETDAKAKKVFFLSNSTERTLVGTTVGAGCDKYYDVTSAFDRAEKGSGFLVNTTEGRHVGALAGTYFFTAYDGGKMKIATLVVRDSRFRTLHCRRTQ